MLDQRFMQSLANDMLMPPEEAQPEMQLAAGPARTDAPQAFVGTRLNVPRAGQAQPTTQDRERLAVGLLDSLAGALRGAAAQTLGLPGDIRSIIDMIAQEGAEKYLGQRSFATTEEILQDTSVRVPGTNINVPFPPVLGENVPRREERQPSVETAEQVGTFLPAPGIPEAVKMAGRAIKATKDMPIGMSIKLIDGTEAPIQKAPKIETKAFKTWFGKSKAVDEAGDPIILYHGSDQSFDEFKGISWFTTSKSDASNYSNIITPGKEHTPNVMPVYLSIKKPKYIDGYATRQDVENAKASGKYDGVVVRNVMGSDKNYFITFQPTQVKSAIGNVGTFDPKDPSIVRGVAVGGGGGAVATQEENQ